MLKRIWFSMIIGLVLFFLNGCKYIYTKEIKELNKTKVSLLNEVIEMKKVIDKMRKEKTEIEHELVKLNIVIQNKRPVYKIKIRLSQSRVSLSISEHIKDSANATEFEMLVDESLYNKLNVGDNYIDKMRVGSLVLHGSFSSWEMKVIEKKIISVENDQTVKQECIK